VTLYPFNHQSGSTLSSVSERKLDYHSIGFVEAYAQPRFTRLVEKALMPQVAHIGHSKRSLSFRISHDTMLS
jgi:hypothetical protein